MWETVAGAWEADAARKDEQLATATATMLGVARVRTGADVLEVACGAGGAGLTAAERVGVSGRVLLTDVAPGMVAAADRRTAHLPHVSTSVCDQVDIEAEDASFDAVLCRLGLMFADAPVAVAEAVRVLKPGGRYAALCWAARADNPWLGLIMDAIGEELGGPFPPPGARGPFTLSDPGALAGVLQAGGLRDVAVTQIDAPLRMPSLHDWWEVVPEIAAPVAVALAGLKATQREAISARAMAHAERVARNIAGGIELGGAVLLASGAAP